MVTYFGNMTLSRNYHQEGIKKHKTNEKIGIVCTGGRTCGVEVEAKGSESTPVSCTHFLWFLA